MEEKKMLTLELTPRQAKILEGMVRLELIYMNPCADILTLEKVNVMNMLHNKLTGSDAFNCDPETFNKAVNYHIAKLEECGCTDEATFEFLRSILK